METKKYKDPTVDLAEDLNGCTVGEYLKHHTRTRELCMIMDSGYPAQAVWIDYEDLFIRYCDSNLIKTKVKKASWDWLTICNENGAESKIRCHFIDI